jgi:hypothetical protein
VTIGYCRKVGTFQARGQTRLGGGAAVIFDFGQNMAGLSTLAFEPARVAAAHE